MNLRRERPPRRHLRLQGSHPLHDALRVLWVIPEALNAGLGAQFSDSCFFIGEVKDAPARLRRGRGGLQECHSVAQTSAFLGVIGA
jgi:hypothetical protein